MNHAEIEHALKHMSQDELLEVVRCVIELADRPEVLHAIVERTWSCMDTASQDIEMLNRIYDSAMPISMEYLHEYYLEAIEEMHRGSSILTWVAIRREELTTSS